MGKSIGLAIMGSLILQKLFWTAADVTPFSTSVFSWEGHSGVHHPIDLYLEVPIDIIGFSH